MRFSIGSAIKTYEKVYYKHSYKAFVALSEIWNINVHFVSNFFQYLLFCFQLKIMLCKASYESLLLSRLLNKCIKKLICKLFIFNIFILFRLSRKRRFRFNHLGDFSINQQTLFIELHIKTKKYRKLESFLLLYF